MEGHLYSPLPERHIRLLTLKPLQDPPSGTLDVVSLDENPKFNVLSYAWGAPGDTLELVCSGKILSVHENLGDFLKLASERHHQRPIWIDAICINQEDDAEKNHQIPLMAEIYNSATQVLAWLGSNSEEGDKAFPLIPLIADTLENATPDIEGETFSTAWLKWGSHNKTLRSGKALGTYLLDHGSVVSGSCRRCIQAAA